MSKEPETVETVEDDYPEILPEGWSGAEGEDIFDPSTWGGDDSADGQDDEADGTEDETEGDDSSRTTEDEEEPETGAEEDGENSTTVLNADDGKLHFTVSIDHKDENIILDPTELPAVYQKARVLDRYQSRVKELEAELSRYDRIAKGLNYADRNAMHDGIIDNIVQDYQSEHPGVPDDMARDYVVRKFGLEKNPAPAEDAKPGAEVGRDYRAEVTELFQAYPEARNERIPDEVTNTAVSSGKPLLQVYMDWKLKQTSAKAKAAEKENKVLKQNAAAARKAPVRRSTGGGKTDTTPSDAFLDGFNSDDNW